MGSPEKARHAQHAERRGVRASETGTVRRYVNSPPSDGPAIFEVRDRHGKKLAQSRDAAGAEQTKNALDRRKYHLKDYDALRRVRGYKNGFPLPVNNRGERQRQTTAGPAGLGGVW